MRGKTFVEPDGETTCLKGVGDPLRHRRSRTGIGEEYVRHSPPVG